MSGSGSWTLDLIRLSEPVERERAKAGSKNCFPSPPDGLFFPVSLPRLLLRWKRLSRLISTGSHWSLSSQPARTLCPAVLPSHQQAPKHKMFFSLQLPLAGHCQGRGQAQESRWHPHESPSCSEPTWNPKLPTPTALAQGPCRQGHGNLAMTLQRRNSPKPSGEEPPGGTCICGAPGPGRDAEHMEGVLGQYFPSVSAGGGNTGAFPTHWQKQ